MKIKNYSVIILVLVILLGLSSCSNIYKKGVEFDDYPERDMPIYDDAIVFEYDCDKDECSITYGTIDDVDDITEFYQEMFEEDDEYIILSEEVDKDEYNCEGYIDDIYFEIEVEEAKREEADYFESVVTVEIKEYDSEDESYDTDNQDIEENSLNNEEEDQENDISEPDEIIYKTSMDELTDLQKQMIGFWLVETKEVGSAVLSFAGQGFAFEFVPDGCFIYYDYLAPAEQPIPWEQTDDNEITIGGTIVYLVSFNDGQLTLSTKDYIINQSTICVQEDKKIFTGNSPSVNLDQYYGYEDIYNTWIDAQGEGVEINFSFPTSKDVFGNPIGSFTSEKLGDGEYVYGQEYHNLVVTFSNGSNISFTYQDDDKLIYSVEGTFIIKE